MKYRIIEVKLSPECGSRFYIEKRILFFMWVSAHDSSHQGGGFGPTSFNSYEEALTAINDDQKPKCPIIKYHYI